MIDYNSKEELSSLYGQKGIGDNYISFRIDLLEITLKYQELIKPLQVIFPGKEMIHNNFEKGSPLIAFTPVSLSLEILSACFREIIHVFQSHGVCSSEACQWFDTHADNSFIKKITKAITSFDMDGIKELSEPTPIDAHTLILISRELVKPFYHVLASQAGEVASFKHWTEGFCPVCGDMPSFARLSKSKEEEGKRYLWCASCDLEWAFQRMCCPSCGNKDHKKLKFLTTNHREELRVDVCEECKGYIKTIDERKTGQEEATTFIKENAASLFLDITAGEKGYMIQFPAFQHTKIKFC
jgi:FdhE protein